MKLQPVQSKATDMSDRYRPDYAGLITKFCKLDRSKYGIAWLCEPVRRLGGRRKQL